MNIDFINMIAKRVPKKAWKLGLVELEKQHKKEPLDYDLSTRVCDQYVDIMYNGECWRVMAGGATVLKGCVSRKAALENFKRIFV